MLKYLILLLSLFLPLSSFAEDRVAMNVGTLGVGGAAPSCASCNSTNDTDLYVPANNSPDANQDCNNCQIARSVSLTSGQCITGYSLHEDNDGGYANGNYYAELWTDSGGSPNTIISTDWRVTYANPGANTYNEHLLAATQTVPSTGTYWVVHRHVGSAYGWRPRRIFEKGSFTGLKRWDGDSWENEGVNYWSVGGVLGCNP